MTSARRALCATLVLSRGDSALALLVVRQAPSSVFLSRGGAVRWRHSRHNIRASADAATCRKALPLMPTRDGAKAEGLWLLNSLTMKNEPFMPIDRRMVKWYICGPTVYDASHIGHARNYIAFDIVRRVMLDYFGFDIMYVMNITDIDDKIILRTHRNHLEQMLAAVRAQLEEAAAANDAAAEEACNDAQQALGSNEQNLPQLVEAGRALRTAAGGAGLEPPAECDVQEAFTRLTYEFEREFFDDMAALNVLPPDAVTRVSDYVPEIIAYIERILTNSYCYEANGSVYFDTAAFAKAGLKYGKLDPSKVGDAELMAEGEGALSGGFEGEKRQVADFVLWKRSKAGEPSWSSPWGEGRPGWHIECSAMASDLLGDKVDLNAGGADLKFPHHENQMAQCEAHYDCCGWVNYFLHSGHLQIEGRKMSKSLKNFVTIREVLDEYRPEAVRFLFLLHKYHEPMEYSQNTMAAAADLERRFSAFSVSLRSRLREASEADAAPAAPPPLHKWGAEERQLSATLHEKRAEVDAALRSSVDTPAALKALEQLIRATNSYLGEVGEARRGATLLTAISRYFHKTMCCFGVDFGADAPVGTAAGSGSASPLQLAKALGAFRDEVRRGAIDDQKRARQLPDEVDSGETTEATGPLPEGLLRLCDKLRDEVLPSLGVRLEDRPKGAAAQLTLDDPNIVMAEVERKREAAAVSDAARLKKLAEKAASASRDAARAAVLPAEMFTPQHDALFDREESFGGFSDDGLPSLDAQGEPLSKSARKKLAKQRDKHAKQHEAARIKAGGAD